MSVLDTFGYNVDHHHYPRDSRPQEPRRFSSNTMEELSNDDAIDMETLQAQIDLEMAHTKNLVSSWMKPAAGSLPSSSKRGDRDKEIEMLLRRPPRQVMTSLGVGAPVPASTGTLAVGGAKLKSKLVGKKRGRDGEDGLAESGAKDSEDENESRGRAIKKKAKVDPFEGTHGKKKKKRHAEEPKGVDAPAVTTVSANSVEEDEQEREQATKDTPVIVSPAPSLLEHALSERKKKKKKKRDHDSDTLPTLSHPSPLKPRDTTPSKFVDTPSSPSPTVQLDATSQSGAETGPSSPRKSDKSPQKSDIPSTPSKVTPLLNLDGPPPDHTEDPTQSLKKKKKKRKKKKTQSTSEEASVGDNI
ncbi:hypothetical protein EIP91_005921 [Steccherinum ochraceum]|uniref:Uncharacterized protein n=1 Tax=Steccherinum ochraceum TaxID=92696 RepID=A0A4R0S1A3_9APHY|nr:hypothetical protein EIP91_005921 [Steccherinum ochraceum]